MNVLTYNIHSALDRKKEHRLEPIASVLKQADADVIALQEVDFNMHRSGLQDQAQWMARALDMHSSYHSLWELHDGAYGIALLSRWPTHRVKKGLFAAAPSRRYVEPRGYILAEITCPLGLIEFVCTHFGLTRREKIEQAKELVSVVSKTSHPTVVMGDLNSRPGSAAYKTLAEGLHHRGKPKRCATFPSLLPLAAIDHILATGELRVKNITTIHSVEAVKASDHLPLCADVLLKEESKTR